MGGVAVATHIRQRPEAGSLPATALAPAARAPAVVPAVPPPSPEVQEHSRPDGRARTLVRRGAEAAERGDLDEAAALMRQATELAPRDPDAWNGLGVALVSRGDVEEGARAFRRALRLLPGHAEAQRNLAVALERQGRPAEAAVHYRAFLKLAAAADPARAEVRRRLAEIGGGAGAR